MPSAMSKPNIQRRKRLIHAIGQLEDTHCESCTNKTRDDNTECVGCPIYNQIREIGEELAPSYQDICTSHGLTVKLYTQLREDGLTDKAIAQRIDVNPTSIKNWKDKYNVNVALGQKRSRHPEEELH